MTKLDTFNSRFLAMTAVVSAFAVLAACGGSTPETPPVAPETNTTDLSETPDAEAALDSISGADDTTDAVDADTAERASEASADEHTEADGHAGDHGGEGESHDDHGDEHHAAHGEEHGEDHADHGDDHEGHDHAGGEAHVHGTAEAAIAIEGDAVTVSFRAPLASVGLSETEPSDDTARAMLGASMAVFDQFSAIVTLPEAAGCTQSDANVETDFSGSHGNMTADYSLTCTDVSAVTEARVSAFAGYPTLETVDAVWLAGDEQVAKTLTSADPVIAP